MDSSGNQDLMLMEEWQVKISLSYAQILSFHAGEWGGSELGTSCSKMFDRNLYGDYVTSQLLKVIKFINNKL